MKKLISFCWAISLSFNLLAQNNVVGYVYEDKMGKKNAEKKAFQKWQSATEKKWYSQTVKGNTPYR